jgi:hypothetical protein
VDTKLDVATEAAVCGVRAEEVLPVPLSCPTDRPALAGAKRGFAVDANGADAGMNASPVDPSHRLRESPAPGARMRSYWLREHQSCRNDADGSPHNHTPSPRDLFRTAALRKRLMLSDRKGRFLGRRVSVDVRYDEADDTSVLVVEDTAACANARLARRARPDWSSQMTGLDHGHESEMLRRFVMGSEWLHAALSPWSSPQHRPLGCGVAPTPLVRG